MNWTVGKHKHHKNKNKQTIVAICTFRDHKQLTFMVITVTTKKHTHKNMTERMSVIVKKIEVDTRIITEKVPQEIPCAHKQYKQCQMI
jgi:hypothetical protein